jgi:hypothetical protein
MPRWAIALIAVAIIGVVAALAWSTLRGIQTRGSGVTVNIDEKPSEYQSTARSERAAFRQRQNQADAAARREADLKGPDFVRPGRNGLLNIKGGATQLTLGRIATGGLRVTLEPMDPAAITEDQRQTIQMRNRIMGEDAVARQLEITADQRKALQAVPGHVAYVVDAPTRKSFDALLAAWEKAPADQKKTAEDSIIAAVRDFESKNAPTFKSALEDRVAKIKSIVTPEQIEKFKAMGK